MICKNCNANLPDEAKFCAFCGAKIDEDSVPVELASPVIHAPPRQARIKKAVEGKNKKPRRKLNKKQKKLIAAFTSVAAVAAIALAVVFFVVPMFKAPTVAPAVYVTDKNELYVIEHLGKKEAKTFKVTDKFGGSYSFSENYKYIVYTEGKGDDDDDKDDEEYNSIYYRKIGDEKSDPVYIAKKASTVNTVIGNIDYIIYTKDGSVYSADSKGSSNKLAKDMDYLSTTDDKEYIVCYNYEYKDREGSYKLSYVNLESGKEFKIADNAEDYAFSPDCSEVYYIVDGKLYKSGVDKKEKQIAKEANSVSCYDNKVYFKVKEKEYSLYDFVEDKYAESDKKIERPNKKDKKYDEKLKEYYAALHRNSIRSELKTNEDDDEIATYSLYYYDGTCTKVADCSADDRISGVLDFEKWQNYDDSKNRRNSASDCAQIDMYTKDLSKIEKINIDDLAESEDVVDDVKSHLDKEKKTVTAIVNGKNVIVVDTEVKEKNTICDYVRYYKGNFYITVKRIFTKEDFSNEDFDYEETNTYDYYKLSENAKDFSKAELVADKVHGMTICKDDVVTYTDYDADASTVTINFKNEKIQDVSPVIMSFYGENDLYLLTDYDEEKNVVTILKYSNGKTTTVLEEASCENGYYSFDSYWIFSYLAYDTSIGYSSIGCYNGMVLAYEDYDEDKKTGTLVCSDGKNKYKIADNVTRFVCDGGSNL